MRVYILEPLTVRESWSISAPHLPSLPAKKRANRRVLLTVRRDIPRMHLDNASSDPVRKFLSLVSVSMC
jgi:hypothetical protein